MATKLYEITLIGQFGSAGEVVNRWNYRGDVNGVTGGDAAGLAKSMGFAPVAGVFPVTTVADAIAQLCSNIVKWNQVLCRSVYDPTDFLDLPFVPVAPGLAPGESLPPICAFGFRSNRVRLDIGRGYKRFPGVIETWSNTGGSLHIDTIPLRDTLANAMGDTLTFTDGTLTNTYLPCIVKKVKYTTPSGKFAYKYYPTEAEQLTHLAVGVTWDSYSEVRSQVSRQYRRGS